jgi:hypothetical protein
MGKFKSKQASKRPTGESKITDIVIDSIAGLEGVVAVFPWPVAAIDRHG